MSNSNKPLDRLKHHVTGAIERGEKTAIEAVMAPKHTPGPWKLNSYKEKLRGSVVLTRYKILAFNMGPDKSPQVICELAYKWAEPDARLIAAAPEMLEALQALYVEGFMNMPFEEQHKRWMLAQAAIAKATGGAE